MSGNNGAQELIDFLRGEMTDYARRQMQIEFGDMEDQDKDSLSGLLEEFEVSDDLLAPEYISNNTVMLRRREVMNAIHMKRLHSACDRIMKLLQYVKQPDLAKWFEYEDARPISVTRRRARIRFLHLLYLHDKTGWFRKIILKGDLMRFAEFPDEIKQLLRDDTDEPGSVVDLLRCRFWPVLELGNIFLTPNNVEVEHRWNKNTSDNNSPKESLVFDMTYVIKHHRGPIAFMDDDETICKQFFSGGFFRTLRAKYQSVQGVLEQTQRFYEFAWRRMVLEEHVMKSFVAPTNNSVIAAQTFRCLDSTDAFRLVPVQKAMEFQLHWDDEHHTHGVGNEYGHAAFIQEVESQQVRLTSLEEEFRTIEEAQGYQGDLDMSYPTLRVIVLKHKILNTIVLRISPQTMLMGFAGTGYKEMDKDCLDSGLWLDVVFEVHYCTLRGKNIDLMLGTSVFHPRLLHPAPWRLVKKGVSEPVVEMKNRFVDDDDDNAKKTRFLAFYDAEKEKELRELWRKFSYRFQEWWGQKNHAWTREVFDGTNLHFGHASLQNLLHGDDKALEYKRVYWTPESTYKLDPVWPQVPFSVPFQSVRVPVVKTHTDGIHNHEFGTKESLRVLAWQQGAFKEWWQHAGGGYGDVLWRTLYGHVIDETQCCSNSIAMCHFGILHHNWNLQRTGDEPNICYYKTFDVDD